MLNEKQKNLTYSLLLQYCSEYDVFSYYLGYNFKLGQLYRSPLRVDDSKPSFNVFYSSMHDRLMFKDFGAGISGDAVHFVKLLRSLPSRRDALEYIYEEIVEYRIKPSNKGINLNSLKKTKEYKEFTVKRARFNSTDLKFWEQFNIDKRILDYYKVNHISTLWVNGELRWSYTKTNPIYSYRIFNKFKIYRPLSNSTKFLTNCRPIEIQGFEQLPTRGKILVITKSLKDVMVLYSLGYTAIAPHSESSYIDEKIIKNLKNRFTTIYVLYDNDTIGKQWSKKLCKRYNFINLCIPNEYKVKDISDYIKKYRKDKTTNLIKGMLEA